MQCGRNDHFSVKCFNGFYGQVLDLAIGLSISLDKYNTRVLSSDERIF